MLDYDKERSRISIGLKQLQAHPWEGVEEKYPVGAKVRGRVVSIARYGAFVELERGLEGLVHISEMSWTQHVKHPSAILSVGDEMDVVVLNIDKENRKISLGLKQVEPDPWHNLEQKYAVGSRHVCRVRDLVPFGAFVELEDGIDGLVHISDLSWTRRVRHPGEVLKKGDEIEVIVLGFDRNERRIALGLKQAQANPWDEFEQMYAVGTKTTGRVARILEKGIVVELPREVEGFVPNSQLKRLARGPKQPLNVGEELPLEVIEFDKESKKIILAAQAPAGVEADVRPELELPGPVVGVRPGKRQRRDDLEVSVQRDEPLVGVEEDLLRGVHLAGGVGVEPLHVPLGEDDDRVRHGRRPGAAPAEKEREREESGSSHEGGRQLIPNGPSFDAPPTRFDNPPPATGPR